MRLRYFMAGLAAFVLCGFGIPGPQGSSAGSSFTGGTLTSDLNMGDNDILGANVIQPTSGQTLVLNDEGGDSALSVGTSGAVTFESTAASWQINGPASANLGILAPSGRSLYFGAGGSTKFFVSSSGILALQCQAQIYDDNRFAYGTGADIFEQGEQTASLSEGSANTVFSLVTADGDYGGLVIHYSIRATDGSDFQTETGVVEICYIDTSGGVSADVDETVSPAAVATSGALSTTWSVVTTDDQSLEVQVTPSSTVITPSSIDIVWKVTCRGDVTLTVP